MKKSLRLAISAFLLVAASVSWADSKVVTTVNGVAEARELVRITFDGDNAVLTYTDSTTGTADMSLVTVTLTHDEQSAIEQIIADQAKASGVYDLYGRRIADTPEGLTPGIYIFNGQKMLVK